MTRLFFCFVVFIMTLSSVDVIIAQQAEEKPATEKAGEVQAYAAKDYEFDRAWTGSFFRKLRRIRTAEGNEAAAARLAGAWNAYRNLRIAYQWEPKSSFDTWGFWVWHEAQFDSGKNDPEWAMLLYRSIYDIAKADKRFDWVTHVRPNLINSYVWLCQWGNVRALSHEAEDYFSGIGFDLDPQKLPATGSWDPKIPFVQQRTFPLMVPNSKHVVYWQRHEQKDPTKPSYMDNLLLGLMNTLASEDYLMGRWDRAIERSTWMMHWSDEIKRLNLGNGKKPNTVRFHDDTYRQATLQISLILSNLGHNEKALQLIERGLQRKGKSQNDMLDHTILDVTRMKLLMESGNTDDALLAKMDEAISREGKFPYIAIGHLDAARYLKADYLVKLGKIDEAEAILKSICERKERKIAGWLSAELKLVDLMLARGEYSKAEKTLYELMEVVRVKGIKMDELALYRTYVNWAMLSGNWIAALRGQREVMRLLESFRMTPILPLEQARLSRIMAELGNKEESDRLAELAKLGSEGRESLFIQLILEELAKRTIKESSKPKDKVIIQPLRVFSSALDKFPSRAVIYVVNQGSREAKGTLKVTGLPANILWDRDAGYGSIEVKGSGGALEKLSEEISIQAGGVAVFSCHAKLTDEISKTVAIEWVGQNSEIAKCEWTIDTADKESVGAVIDAAEYQDDPFFLIPIYHHLQSKNKSPVNLRVVTSQPCRVEMYDEDGVLQMVDSAGNGKLSDSGDWLGEDRDRNLAAELLPDEKTGESRFLLHLDPKDWNGHETIKVRIEWLVNGTWFLAAEDQILFRK